MSHTDESRRLRQTRADVSSTPPDESDGWITHVLGPLQYKLWFIVVSAMAADVLLTMYGLELGLTELNPIAVRAISAFGYAGLGLLKCLALGIGVVCWALTPHHYAPIIPLGLATPSIIAVCINTVLVFLVI
ncbi:DUF5658 family protein [Haladaptatus sp. ZSTT2]|uniref:DUF5658 family protein n=1 Tax=Haladaptatus sp. ZSTT2 TaxID=3120515 RepID=UPI00300F23CA